MEKTADKNKRLALIVWSIVGIIIILFTLLKVAAVLQPVLYPFIYALIIVFILRPVVNLFIELRLPRFWAVIVTYIIFILIFSLLVLYLLPVAVRQVKSLVLHLSDYSRLTSHWLDLAQRRYSRLRLPRGTDKVLLQLAQRAQESGIRFIGTIPKTTTGLFGGLFNIVVALIIAFYILKDLSAIRETFINLFPEKYRDGVVLSARKVIFIVGGYLRGQALVSLLVGTTISLYLWLIGVHFALLLGLIAGVLNIVPYFGPIVGGAVAAVVAFTQAPLLALWVVIGMFAIQQIDGSIISPTIMGRVIDLHPAWIIFSLLTGGVLLGFLGLLLAIPTAAVAKALVMYYFYEDSDIFSQEA